jgi:hypothetical protein
MCKDAHVEQRISLVTLGVNNLGRARAALVPHAPGRLRPTCAGRTVSYQRVGSILSPAGEVWAAERTPK